MKAAVYAQQCWGCGYCAATCPAVFRIEDKDAKAHVYALPTKDNEELVKQVSQDCPAQAIEVWD